MPNCVCNPSNQTCANHSPQNVANLEAKLAAAEKFRDQADAYADQLRVENARLREALKLIAQSKRADGTYNRCREACEELARNALQHHG